MRNITRNVLALATAALAATTTAQVHTKTIQLWPGTTVDKNMEFRVGQIDGDAIHMGRWIYFNEGDNPPTIVLQIRYVDGPNIEPPDPELPVWWPSNGIEASTADLGVQGAIDAVDGVGGVLTLSTQEDADQFVTFLSSTSEPYPLSGRIDEYGELETLTVVRAEEGVRLRRNLRVASGPVFRGVYFYGLDIRPDSHDNADAVHLRGPNEYVGFVACNIEGWGQGIIFGSDDPSNSDAKPRNIEISGNNFTRIFKKGAPPQLGRDHRDQPGFYGDKNLRSQSIYVGAGEGFVVRDNVCTNNGWDADADPDRKTPSFYSQIFYFGQDTYDIHIVGNVFDGGANNAIVAKGGGFEVRDNTATRIVNFISCGTNESEVRPFSGVITGNVASEFLPVNWKDDGSLPSGEQVPANSGVAVSLVYCDGVRISDNVWGPQGDTNGLAPRRDAAYWISNGKDSLPIKNVEVYGDRLIGFGSLVELRNHETGPTLGVAFSDIEGSYERKMLVRNWEPETASRAQVARGVTLDGAQIETR